MRGFTRRSPRGLCLVVGLTACLEVDPSFMGDMAGTGTGSGGTGTDASGTTTSGGATSGGPGTTGSCDAVETCNGADDDCDGLVDEVSADNPDCDGCTLEQFEDHAYWFCPDTRRWQQARGDCLDRGAALVSIPSEAVNTFLAGHLGASFPDQLWTGGNDQVREGTFAWEDGTAWGYENWNMGEPNDQGGEDCMEMWSNPAGTWNDSDCMDMFAFVCWAPHAG